VLKAKVALGIARNIYGGAHRATCYIASQRIAMLLLE
jgi:hypothetical protein